MSRSVEWRSVTNGQDKELTDHIGMLGPLRAFTLSQIFDKEMWELTSHFIPSKLRGKVFTDIEAAKRACSGIVEGFSKWLAG